MKNLYNFFRYDLPASLQACRIFYRAVCIYRSWDWWFVLNLFYTALLPLKHTLEQGHEIEEDRLPKIAAISRVCDILQHLLDDTQYIRLAEQELGITMIHCGIVVTEDDEVVGAGTDAEQQNDYLILDRAKEIEQAEWTELWTIIHGSPDRKGSDLRRWWD